MQVFLHPAPVPRSGSTTGNTLLTSPFFVTMTRHGPEEVCTQKDAECQWFGPQSIHDKAWVLVILEDLKLSYNNRDLFMLLA